MALEIVLGRDSEAIIIAVLLVLNAGVSLLQEGRAGKALELLRSKLVVQARGAVPSTFADWTPLRPGA